MVNGVRVSDYRAIPFIKMAAFDVANTLMTMLAGEDESAVIGNWVLARSMGVIDGKDYKTAGKVERIKTGPVGKVLGEGFIPIFPCIGWSSLGKPYNLLSDELALFLSIQLGAAKLFYITAEEGLKGDEFTLPEGVSLSREGRVSHLDLQKAKEFLSLNEVKEGGSRRIIELIGYGVKACRSGVNRVHIVDGRMEGVILVELFSNLGYGTMIYSNQYDMIRYMELNDIPDVLRIMEPFIAKGILISRTADTLKEEYRDFVVYEVDGSIHACGALHVYPEGWGEIAGVAVDENFDHLGIGQKIVRYLLDKAREKGLRKVFLLTTQTGDWFERLGFVEGDVSALPSGRRKAFSPARGSRIYISKLD